MRLFFAPPEHWTADAVTITGTDVGHIRRVLRLKPGDVVTVSDGAGRMGRVKIGKIGEGSVEGTLIELLPLRGGAGPAVTLAQGLPKGRKFELVVQKAVELGASKIVPVASARSVVRLEGTRASERLERWRRIAREAAKQCRRPSVPEVAPPASLEEFLSGLGPPAEGELRVLLWEEASEPLRDVLTRPVPPESIVCLVGPEGGFEPSEASRAVEAGFRPASLGSRVLRTETAPLALLAVLQFLFEGPAGPPGGEKTGGSECGGG